MFLPIPTYLAIFFLSHCLSTPGNIEISSSILCKVTSGSIGWRAYDSV